MHHDVSIRGGYQSDFARNSSKKSLVNAACGDLWDIPASARRAAFVSGSVTTLGDVAGDSRVDNAEPFGAKDFHSITTAAVSRVFAVAQG